MVGFHRLGIWVCLAVSCTLSSPRAGNGAHPEDQGARDIVCAIRDGDKAAVRALLGQGANVNEPDEAGVTPLSHAALNADLFSFFGSDRTGPGKPRFTGRHMTRATSPSRPWRCAVCDALRRRVVRKR